MNIGIVVPHIFMQRDILPHVIFSPGTLALDLAAGLQTLGATVTLFSPGPVDTPATNIVANLAPFQAELDVRGDGYLDLLKKHPLTFISLARQVQSELIAKAYAMANSGQLDIVHIYTNEEDLALPFAQFCQKPVVFTHHDPFNFSVAYKHVFPQYSQLNWLAISDAQRQSMPADTNWLRTIYHGLQPEILQPTSVQPRQPYVAYLGRIIQPKGVHIAIQAVLQHNATAAQPLQLRIAGKHYAGGSKDSYWREQIEPLIDGKTICYQGFVKTPADKQAFLGQASALVIPSLFDEPFGMVMIEALACGTPIIGLNSGAIPEVITPQTGIVVNKALTPSGAIDESATSMRLAHALAQLHSLERAACRADFMARFTLERMCHEHLDAYRHAIKQSTK